MKRRVDEDGRTKEKSFRFGRSIWIIGKQSDIAKAAMVGKAVISDRMQRLEEQEYLRYVGLWTYELTTKGLETINSKLPKFDIPSDYKDYVNIRGGKDD